MHNHDHLSELSLSAIAKLLRIPVKRFFEAEPTPQPTDTDECLRLWFGLRTDAGRAAALNALLWVADQEGR